MNRATTSSPDWDHLFEIAAAQDGLFTTRQAAAAGYSPQLIAHHLSAGRMVRVRRGVYRLVHFPAREHEDLTEVWLWSEQEGVFSHQTALALHDLSDVLPAQVHLTLPEKWRTRRLRVPDGVILHYADVAESERRWFGPVPATAPLRTLEDCAAEHQAFKRRLIDGEQAAPPEYCGGTPDYEQMVHFVETGEDTYDDDPDGLAAWLDGWRPDAFDLAWANAEFDR